MTQRCPCSITTSQLKRTHHASTPHDQPIDSQSSIQQLISRIQSTILQTSQSMKQRLTYFQQQQLINYKNDLLKTQQQFIKIKAQRNEDAIKTRMLKEKAKVEQKFNTQIQKSMEMNAKYQKMKGLVKKMNQDQRQLILQINYVKKKIQKELKEGDKLDEDIKQMMEKANNNNNNNNSDGRRYSYKKVSKLDEERKLFKDLVNKCENQGNSKNIKQTQDHITQTNTLVQNYPKKMEKRLKYQISNLKDYIENIPLQLNFIENMLYSSIKEKFENAKIELKEQIQGEEDKQKENQEEGEDNYGNEDKQNDKQKGVVGKENQNNSSVRQKKLIKLPNITNMNLLQLNSTKKPIKTKQNPKKQLNTPTKIQPQKPIQSKNKIVQKQKIIKQNEQIPNIEQLPKSSALLQEILSYPQVKEYLYKVLFKGTCGQEE